jgi:outer membrane receptor protein involved in Fe transport
LRSGFFISGSRLPQTPPDRLSLRARGSMSKLGPLSSPFIELESVWVDKGVPSGDDEVFNGRPFGAATDSYNLLHLKAGFELSLAGNAVSIDVYVRNLLDEGYTDFLHPYIGLPYQGKPVLDPGRDIRLLVRYRF